MATQQEISRIGAWIKAFRLHTLPLAVAGMLLGDILAYPVRFSWAIALLSLLTALSLQVLSNLANDYGDAKNGADNEKRNGPARMVQSGIISMAQMKTGIILSSLFSLICGISLLAMGWAVIGRNGAIALLALGLLSILAAITYTASKRPYGYRGLGDLSVFIFFGLVSVGGSYFLQTGEMSPWVLLPAAAMGLLCAGVLNVNNMRDIETDALAHKITVPVVLGLRKAKIYHWVLMMLPLVLFVIYLNAVHQRHWPVFLCISFIFVFHGIRVSRSTTPEEMNPNLKALVLSILGFVFYFGLCTFIV